MKDFFAVLWKTIKRQKFGLLALAIVVGTWIWLATVIPNQYLDVFAYAVLGWYWLGEVVVPWVEAHLERLFG